MISRPPETATTIFANNCLNEGGLPSAGCRGAISRHAAMPGGAGLLFIITPAANRIE